MRHLFAFLVLLGVLAVASPPARAATALDGIALPDTGLAYAKMKGPRGKAVRRHGPPSWAPAHGFRRKFHR